LAVAGAWLLAAAPASAQKGLLGKIDLMTAKGVEAVKGQWRYHPVTTGVGKDGNEIEPTAHGKIDDSKWEVLAPETLKKARGPGKYSWCWYRHQVTIPDQVGGKSFAGGPVWFQTIVDDYGEIWVDGEIDRAFGASGRGAVSGFNTRNRVRLQKFAFKTVEKDGKARKVKVGRDALPGDVFQIAVLGINSPLGDPPGNKIFLRAPTNLEFFGKDAPNGGADQPSVAGPPPGKMLAEINLMKKEGTAAVKGTWRRHLLTVHTGPNKNEIEPKAHGKFDDSKWEAVEDPALLAKRYGPGKFSMAWYRIQVTIPEQVDGKNIAGTAVWFRTTVDDYGEVWVNGGIDRSFGKSGRGAVSGFNTPNEVKLADKAKPGQTFQIAVLAINSPFGNPPNNYIFFRSPTALRFYTPAMKAEAGKEGK
jgi:hypothetical protein